MHVMNLNILSHPISGLHRPPKEMIAREIDPERMMPLVFFLRPFSAFLLLSHPLLTKRAANYWGRCPDDKREWGGS